MRRWLVKQRRWLALLLVLPLVPLLLHFGIRHAARLTPPGVEIPGAQPRTGPNGTRRLANSLVRRRGQIFEVQLSGTPVEIGYAHVRLLYPQMVDNERVLLEQFERTLPSRLARTALLDLALLRYHDVAEGMSTERLREIAAGARAFAPDPFGSFLDTFQRFVYLNALYDIALSFEHSPLIGCTSFVLNAGAADDGEPLLARNFDFEVDPIFDDQKAVFWVREAGKQPFASVAWPGLVGVVSGMNLAGLAAVVHGGRAGEPSNAGEPVVHALRRVLSEAEDTQTAIRRLAERPVMVSHLVVLMDAQGDAAVVERAPGHADHVRRLDDQASVTNHFEGPLATDPRNQSVMQQTSTLERRQRADELLQTLATPARPEDAARLLRDRRGKRGRKLRLGDRRAIDALIATHGVIMNTRRRQLWVSEGPHLLGRFLLFDLEQLSEHPERPGPLHGIPADPELQSPEVRQALRAPRRAARQ